MIKAVFQRDTSGMIAKFHLTGHADAGKYGYDIVCAAVSAVSIGAVNGIEALAGYTPTVTADQQNGGDLSLAVAQPLTGEQNHITQILLENLLLELQSIHQEYPDRIMIQTKQLA